MEKKGESEMITFIDVLTDYDKSLELVWLEPY